MLNKHDNLVVVGATQAPQSALARFREETGAAFPILYGVSDGTLEAYGIRGTPSLVLLAADGSIAGRSEKDVAAALGG